VAALALARLGSTRPFGLIAFDLALPTSMANQVGSTWKLLLRGGTWPTFLADLNTLYDRLADDPPPINYRDRRILGEDTDLIAAALTQAADTIDVPHPDLPSQRRFWELFTGGDIAYGPAQLQLPPASTDYATHVAERARVDEAHMPLFRRAHQIIHENAAIRADGPLTWQPP